MRYYPVFLDVKDKTCLVVGGGGVGGRKVGTLLECGARVVVVSPEVEGEVCQLEEQGKLTVHCRAYEESDLDGVFLVIGATNDEEVNKVISAHAHARNILCNIADRPAECSFVLPSIVHQGDLVIAISTAGKSPAFAKRLRRELTQRFGPEYGVFLDLMGRVRQKLLAREHAPEEHKPLFEKLIDGGLLDFIRQKDCDAAGGLLMKVLGPEFSIDEVFPDCD